jgi:VWFA-related protein
MKFFKHLVLRRLLLVVANALPLLFALILDAQEEVKVTNVSVWIKATDKSGKPVIGLTQSDFEIYEDGKKVTPTCFEEVSFAEESTTATQTIPMDQTQPADNARKQVVLLMDQANTSQSEFIYLRKKAAEFVNQLSQTWDISLVSLIPGLIMVNIDNSRDAAAIQKELDKMSANLSRDIDSLNKRRDLLWFLKERKNIAGTCEMALKFALEEKAISHQWIDSLKQFDRYIRKQTPETHKVVLLFSGGISSSPGKQYFDAVRNSDLVRQRYPDDWDFVRDYPACSYEQGLDLQKELKKLVAQLNRYNITFYTVNSRGPINDLLETAREADRRIEKSDLQFLEDYADFMELIADDTGGVYFGKSLNFKKGFDAILADLNHQYLICYKPPEHTKEGAHSIKVKSTKDGVKLRHREGYYD